jgi:hypothetical protein
MLSLLLLRSDISGSCVTREKMFILSLHSVFYKENGICGIMHGSVSILL